MPTPAPRPSLTTTLDQRYAVQHAGGAFEVKEVLFPPGVTPPAGTVIDAASQNGATFQNPNGFLVKPLIQVSQLIEVQTGGANGGISLYAQNLDTRKYRP